MSYLNKMYGKTTKQPQVEKNPARVAGGLRAQGANTYDILDENGSVKQIPSQRYVSSLEEQIKKLREHNGLLEKKTTKLSTQVNQLEVVVRNMANRAK